MTDQEKDNKIKELENAIQELTEALGATASNYVDAVGWQIANDEIPGPDGQGLTSDGVVWIHDADVRYKIAVELVKRYKKEY